MTVVARSEDPGEPIAGIQVVAIQPRGTAAAEPWPGEWLTLVVDGREHILAVFSDDGTLHQALWSESTFLAWVFHSGLAAEITVYLAHAAFAARAGRDQLAAAFDQLAVLGPVDAPGRRALVAALRSPERSS